MKGQILLDTGPLVAFIDSRDSFHDWAIRTFQTVQYPLFTCEPVITEAFFLLRSIQKAQQVLLELIGEGAIYIDFSLYKNANTLSQLISQYSSVPMSLADACLVRMAELHKDSAIMTLDSDFRIYRMHRNQIIPVVMPEH